MITFVTRDRVWLYDVARDTATALVQDERAQYPTFEDARQVTFVSFSGTPIPTRSFVREVSTSGGQPRTLFEFAGYINAYSWSPGRTALAFVAGTEGDSQLRVWRRGAGTSLVRSFGSGGGGGRGGGDADDISVRWSPDGERVLVTITPFDTGPKPTMYVIRHGMDVVPPRYGAQGIWSADGKTIYYMSWRSPSRWMALDVASNTETRIGIADGGVRARLSLDGTAIAYDRGAVDRTVHVYALPTGTDRKVADGGVAALWRDSGALFVNKVSSCSADRDCGDSPYYLEDEARLVLVGGGFRSTHLTRTIRADVLYV